jgi:hypothetical protein
LARRRHEGVVSRDQVLGDAAAGLRVVRAEALSRGESVCEEDNGWDLPELPGGDEGAARAGGGTMRRGRVIGLVGLVGLVGLALAAPPVPPVPKIAKARAKLSRKAKAAVVTQGAGAGALIMKAVVVVAAPRTNVFPWIYPKTIAASNYWWNLETSTDLWNWAVVCSNATGDYTVTNNKAEARRWWRLHGRTTP